LAESSGPQDSESKRILGKEPTVKKLCLKNMVFRHIPVMYRDFLCFDHRRTFPLEVTHVSLDLRESPRVIHYNTGDMSAKEEAMDLQSPQNQNN